MSIHSTFFVPFQNTSSIELKALALKKCITRIEEIISEREAIYKQNLNSHRPLFDRISINSSIGADSNYPESLYPLIMHQIRTGNIQEAIESLSIFKAQPVIVGLQLQLSTDTIAWAMEEAAKQKTVDDKIFIYEQISHHYPYNLDVYEKVLPLIRDTREKGYVLSRAADVAHHIGNTDYEASYRESLESRNIFM